MHRWAGFLLIAATLLAAAPRVHAAHDRDYWRRIIGAGYAVPDGESAPALAQELVGYVASTDPELRDSFGYEILARWIHRSGKLGPAEFEHLRRALVPRAAVGLGAVEGDSVFGRSFALLNLKELAAADLKRGFLTQATFDELLLLALRSLAEERDQRGYVAGKGWAHAVAHAGDLVRVLSVNPRFAAAQQELVVEALVRRVKAPGPTFAWGEDARLAAALVALASRPDVELRVFTTWFGRLADECRVLWAGEFDVAHYRAVRAQVNTLAHFSALASQPRYAAVAPEVKAAVSQVLAKCS